MKWLRPLYVGEGIKKNVHRVIRVIESGEKSSFAFCCLIVLASHGDENLDIMPVFTLRRGRFPGKDAVILGLARDRSEAKRLVLTMLEDCMAAGGGLALRAFFEAMDASHYADSGEVSLSEQ